MPSHLNVANLVNVLFFQVQANVIDVALFGELSDRSNLSHWIKVHNCVACGFCK